MAVKIVKVKAKEERLPINICKCRASKVRGASGKGWECVNPEHTKRLQEQRVAALKKKSLSTSEGPSVSISL